MTIMRNLLKLLTAVFVLIAFSTINAGAQNLIVNGDFESADLSDWTTMLNEGNGARGAYSLMTTGAPEGQNYLMVDVDTAGSNAWDVQMWSSHFEIVQDAQYKVVCLAKSDVATSQFRVVLQGSGQSYGAFKTLTSEWDEYSWYFTVTESFADAYIKFWFPDSAAYEIDNIVVVDPFYSAKEDQTIDFPAIEDKLTSDASFTVTATSSSGLPVTLTVVSGPATIDGNTVTLTGATGTVTISASQAGDDTYNAAPDVEQSFTVTDVPKDSQTIDFQALENKFKTEAPFKVSATATSGLPVTFSVVSGPATMSNDTVTLDGIMGTVTIRASQAGDETYAAAPDVEQSFDVINSTFDQNLLFNGGFEEGLTGWENLSKVENGAVTSFSLETSNSPEGVNHMKIDVDTVGSVNWDIQSLSTEFGIIKDSTYHVAWLAKSTVEGAQMQIVWGSDLGQKYTGKRALTTEWTKYTHQFTAGVSGDALLKIWWIDSSDYFVDSIVVVNPHYNTAKQAQTIDFTQVEDKMSNDAPFTVSATASSDLPVVITVVSGPATFADGTVTLTGEIGTVTLRAYQAGDDTYNPAIVEQTFNVSLEGTEQTLELDVKFVLETLTIDGVANEESWLAITETNATNYFNDVNNEPDYYTNNPAADDLSAAFKVLWSEAGIYVYADITDDVIHTDSADLHLNGNAHTYDNIEMFFHVPEADWTENLKASSDYVNTTFQMRSNINAGDFWSGRSTYATGGGQGWVNGTTNTSLNGYYDYAFATKDGGVTFEAFYSFDKLFIGTAVAKPIRLGDLKSILFELTYGDSDGSGVGGVRSGGISWNSIPDALDGGKGLTANNRKQFGKINLTPALAVDQTSIDEKQLNVNIYPTVFNRFIRFESEQNIVDVSMFNSIGIRVLHIQESNGITSINNLDYLNNGVYFLRLKVGDEISTVKVIKN